MRYTLDQLRGRDVLLVASTGGHLSQLHRLAPHMGLGPNSRWITFDTPQSRGLLEGQKVTYVPYVAPRDWRGIMRALRRTRRLRRQYEGAVSTGAGLALGVLPAMLLRRRPTVYIESISRVEGPSMSGRILERLPRIGLYAQHPWAYGPWALGPCVLADYRIDEPRPLPQPVRRIYVTLGTIKPYRFDRLVDTVLSYVREHPDVEVRWQTGCTTRDDLPGTSSAEMSPQEFQDSIEWADVVVAHSGVGVAMSILDAGKKPVLLARSTERGEHVDEHQHQIHDFLVERDLAADAEQVLADPEALALLAGTRVERGGTDLLHQAGGTR